MLDFAARQRLEGGRGEGVQVASCRTLSVEAEWVCPSVHGRVARGGLPKVSPGPAMPHPSMPCSWASPESTMWLFQGWPARRAGNLQLSSSPLVTPCRTPMLHVLSQNERNSEVCSRAPCRVAHWLGGHSSSS
jgi:hypothetical protein